MAYYVQTQTTLGRLNITIIIIVAAVVVVIALVFSLSFIMVERRQGPVVRQPVFASQVKVAVDWFNVRSRSVP